MRKIFTFVLALGILFSLCGCSKQNPSTNDSGSSRTISQPVSSSADYSDYQSYTVDDHGNILDPKTGKVMTNDILAVDSSGNIVLKENQQVVVSSEQVQENKKLYSSSQNTSSQSSSQSASKTEEASRSSASKKSTSSAVKPAASSKPAPHSEPVPMDKAKNWDSLYGQKEWTFFNTEASRQKYDGSSAFVCRFSAGQDSHATISVESYCLLDEWKYPLNNDNVVRTINGQKYVQTFWSGYKGDLYTFVGSEDTVKLELKCYDATGHNWLSDELKFKRTNNNSLQLISGDYNEFGLKNGDVFVR
ncbi:hypothetical protein LY85_3851 [Clostridium sp. KNHs216]|nr:hypothetical protein LY85_3851 [Clostridium sp. KNHs216]